MTKKEFWTLNILGGACALLILGTVILGEVNRELNQSALAMQNQFNQAQQMQGTAQNLVSRIAQVAPKEPVLQELLTRHQVKFNGEAPAKPAP